MLFMGYGIAYIYLLNSTDVPQMPGSDGKGAVGTDLKRLELILKNVTWAKNKVVQPTYHKVSLSKVVVDRVNVVPELSLTYAISLKMSTSVDTIVTGKIHTKSKDVQGLEG